MKEKHIHHRVKSIFNELTQSEKKIAQMVLDTPDAVIQMTASELAKASQTSPASVIRFCRSIGISGFTELKLKLSAEVDAPRYTEYSDISQGEPVKDIKNKLLGNAYQSMRETVNLIDEEVIDATNQLIRKAPIVYVYGLGASYLVAENIAQKWNRIGKTVVCLSDAHLFLVILTSAVKEAVFIGISNSGETKEVIHLLKVAKNSGLKTISMTQFGANTISGMTDISIQTVRSNEAELRSAATSSLLAQFMAIDVLFYAYVSENYTENITRIRQSREVVEQYKKESFK
ncbi:RpiR family transcriptional regulator [Enterococcus sp. JM4C]|uniref:MurR/RpiR family transcriptional regulator n=1 Tax=Candidatus Enterococcus huntleyi TaxID=1857217 RepID=UPI0013797348|nr:MurR/RpiR family transcriptional regulator [Enterococcus sp. JM4C]KAF1297375.1 RpiR family transcriptional regulator [Enterococcus sp. JM4C]